MSERVWEGKYLAVEIEGTWEYAVRARGIEAAVIVAVDQGHILLVEQYLEFARELAQTVAVMDRGSIALSGPAALLDEPDVRRRLLV